MLHRCFLQDQKLQVHLTAKEEHHKKLNEVERCYATIACQFGAIKGVHGKLEHSGMYLLNVLQHLVLLCFDNTDLSGGTWQFRKRAATLWGVSGITTDSYDISAGSSVFVSVPVPGQAAQALFLFYSLLICYHNCVRNHIENYTEKLICVQNNPATDSPI